MTINPRATLAAGYAASTPPNRAQQSVAAEWRPKPHIEALIKACNEDPEFYASLPVVRRAAIGAYEEAKAVAAAAGVDTTAAVLNMQQGNTDQ